MATPKLDDLPNELLVDIFGHLVNRRIYPSGTKQDLRNLCLVSRRLRLVTQAFLHKSVSFSPFYNQEIFKIDYPHAKIANFFRTFLLNPELASHLTALKLSWEPEAVIHPQSEVESMVIDFERENFLCAALKEVLDKADRLQCLILSPRAWAVESILPLMINCPTTDYTVLPRGFHGLRYLEIGNGLDTAWSASREDKSPTLLPISVPLSLFFIPGLQTLRLMRVKSVEGGVGWYDNHLINDFGTSTVTELFISHSRLSAEMIGSMLRLPKSLKRLAIYAHSGFQPEKVGRSLEIVQSTLEELHIVAPYHTEETVRLLGSLQNFTALKVLQTCICLMLGQSTSGRVADLLPPQIEKFHLISAAADRRTRTCLIGSLASLSSLTSVRVPLHRLTPGFDPLPPLSELFPTQLTELSLVGRHRPSSPLLREFPSLKRAVVPEVDLAEPGHESLEELDLRLPTLSRLASYPNRKVIDRIQSQSPHLEGPMSTAVFLHLYKYPSLRKLRIPARLLITTDALPPLPTTLQTLILTNPSFRRSTAEQIRASLPTIRSALSSLPNLRTLIAPIQLVLPTSAITGTSPETPPIRLPDSIVELKLTDSLNSEVNRRTFADFLPPIPHVLHLAKHKLEHGHTPHLRAVVYELRPVTADNRMMSHDPDYPVNGKELQAVKDKCAEAGIAVRGVWDLGPGWEEKYLLNQGEKGHAWMDWRDRRHDWFPADKELGGGLSVIDGP